MKKKWYFIALVIFIVFSGPVFAQKGQTEKRPWDIKDGFRMKSIRDLEMCPDGESFFVTVSERNPQNFQSSSSLWLFPLAGGEPKSLLSLQGSISNPKWSPDGKKIAFFSSEKEGFGLWVMARDGSMKKKLTDLEKSNAYLGMRGKELCWSPDGKKIAYNAAGPRYYDHNFSPTNPPTGNDVMVIDRLLYKAFYYYSDMRRTYVYVIPADGGKPEQISFGEYDYHSISWSPDGKRIACISNRTGKDDYNANNDLCLLSTEGKSMIQLTRTIGPEYWPVWSPDGSKIAYLQRIRDHRSKESDAENYKVCVIRAKGGDPVNLTAPLDQWSTSPVWSSDSKQVYFTAQNTGRVCLYVAPVEGGKVTPLIEDYGQVGGFGLKKNGEIFFIYQDFARPAEVYRLLSGGKKEQLTSFNQKFTAEVEIVIPEEFTCKSFDGLQIEGWIMKPLDFKEGKKYPLILNVHGGPHGQYGYNISAFYQYLAANGYAVMFTNPRGSTGYGQKFSDGCVGDLGGGDYKDVMACVDYVLGKYKFIDPQKLGVTGGSYGGYLTNWIITQNNRFKAAVPVASISNLISDWGTDSNTDWFESDGGFMPFENYEKAWAMSPLKYVTNCKTPTLFIHGAWDFCVNLGQAEEMYTALKKLGIDAVLAIYPNEGHGLRQPEHIVDYHQRALAWFKKYLK